MVGGCKSISGLGLRLGSGKEGCRRELVGRRWGVGNFGAPGYFLGFLGWLDLGKWFGMNGEWSWRARKLVCSRFGPLVGGGGGIRLSRSLATVGPIFIAIDRRRGIWGVFVMMAGVGKCWGGERLLEQIQKDSVPPPR